MNIRLVGSKKVGNGGRECGKNISVGRVQDTTLFKVASPTSLFQLLALVVSVQKRIL